MTIEMSVIAWGICTVAAVVGSHVRMETRINEWVDVVKEVRKVIGTGNGDEARFVTTRECGIQENAIRRELDQIGKKLDIITKSLSGPITP